MDKYKVQSSGFRNNFYSQNQLLERLNFTGQEFVWDSSHATFGFRIVSMGMVLD